MNTKKLLPLLKMQSSLNNIELKNENKKKKRKKREYFDIC